MVYTGMVWVLRTLVLSLATVGAVSGWTTLRQSAADRSRAMTKDEIVLERSAVVGSNDSLTEVFHYQGGPIDCRIEVLDGATKHVAVGGLREESAVQTHCYVSPPYFHRPIAGELVVARRTVEGSIRWQVYLTERTPDGGTQYLRRSDCFKLPLGTWYDLYEGKPGPGPTLYGHRAVQTSEVRKWPDLLWSSKVIVFRAK